MYTVKPKDGRKIQETWYCINSDGIIMFKWDVLILNPVTPYISNVFVSYEVKMDYCENSCNDRIFEHGYDLK